MDFTPKEKDQILAKFQQLKDKAVKSRKKENIELINQAFDFANKAHYPVRRKSGEPYILHPIAVATIVADEIMLGTTSIVTALLHDVVEDTNYTLEDIQQLFGKKIASLVDGLTKMSGVFNNNTTLQAENFRKILLSMSNDVRIILIKFADRLHNMRTLESMPENKQLKIASETLFLFAPLAHRLGLYQMKTELEDISFKYTHPEEYEIIRQNLNETDQKRTTFINKFALPIQAKLTELGYDFEVSGRAKSIYSIWQKMENKGVPFEEIYDLFAIRIIFTPKGNSEQEKEQCYKIYSLITDIYKPKLDRLRDWVNTPKSNGYEALHSTVMGPNGKWVEVQIRTQRMNELAERGYAAHWKYKGQNDQSNLDIWLDKIKETIESPDANALEFLDNLQMNLLSPEINIFTPKGDAKSIPKSATALDFAYSIHTKIGDQALYAEINHKGMPIETKLKSGDQVRIITSQQVTPKEIWLNFATTTKAKNAIKNYLNKERQKIIEKGKIIYVDFLKKLDIKLSNRLFERLWYNLQVKNKEDIFYGLGAGSFTVEDLKKIMKNNKSLRWIKFWALKNAPKTPSPQEKLTFDKKKILTIYDTDIKKHFHIARCCNPIPGDNAIGYNDDEGIIHIHKSTCAQAVKLSSGFGDRIIKVKWISHKEMAFITTIKIEGLDRTGLMHEVTDLISNNVSANIKTIHINSDKGRFFGYIEIFVYDLKQLKSLINDLKNIKGITKIHREHSSIK